MAADSTVLLHNSAKIQSALVAPWPNAIDIYNDITKQGLATTFQTKLVSAMRTRGLLEVIEMRPPSLKDLLEANPGCATADAHPSRQYHSDTAGIFDTSGR